jgi:hypothetical protein
MLSNSSHTYVEKVALEPKITTILKDHNHTGLLPADNIIR